MDDPETTRGASAIPVVEEVLTLSKRKIHTGTVRIEKTVESRDYLITESLRRETAAVERFPCDTEVDPNNPPQVRTENGVTIIPVLEEVLVVEKRLILKEELHVRQAVSEVTTSQPVTLKKEQLTFNRSDSLENTDSEEPQGSSASAPDSSLT
ncbi:YsnF/AvaK domain-containing protein [Pseudomonas japonica]|uniref:YsnF/AvaK domain-containing protein n=1 Tax=Pseudomonas japonica TaxID=256466 RepID=UPI0015E3083E|nr:YsnF/AvaK domain-containing protein [Pseudomonas japonica]MBA1291649.1 YsnF/AvaK domain-containing protein [Pseudomonas japonica]